jgi:flagellar hook assembly protein FlgD
VITPAVAAALRLNDPNPFNPTTTIEYTVAERGPAVIAIYDAKGALVARLDQGTRPAGTYRVEWNGRDASGRAVASGVYFYSLAGAPEVAARKMVLLK